VREHRDGTADAHQTSRAGVYADADGNRTKDAGRAAGGEILERERDGRAMQRTWFLIREVELKWMPMSEAVFLLCVLALLLLLTAAVIVLLL
jgi:hypothetical protein